MSVKTLIAPDGRTLRFGRKRPSGEARLKLKDYLSAALPPAPDCNYANAATEALGQIYGNDIYGDCVIACAGHLFGVLRENAGGNRSIFSDGEIVNQYAKCCGYIPGDPTTDDGCEVQSVLGDILQNGFKGHRKKNGEKVRMSHRIAGWLAVDGSNQEEVRQACYLFENLVFGAELPDAWVNPFPGASGFTWDVAGSPDSDNGHSFLGCATVPSGVGIGTWGMTGIVTYAAIKEYTSAANNGELYTVLSEEAINRAKQIAPNEMAWMQLEADFKSLGGNISV